MIATLARHDDAYRYLPKWIAIMVFLATTWLGLATALGDRIEPWLLVALCWLGPASHLALTSRLERSRDVWLALPIPGRSLWAAHGLALLLASGAVLGAILVAAFGSVILVGSLSAELASRFAPIVRLLAVASLHMVAMWLLAIAVMQARRPQLAGPTVATRHDLVFAGGLVVITTASIVGLGHWGRAAALLPVVLAIAITTATWRRIPGALLVAPTGLAPEDHGGGRRDITAPDTRATVGIPWWRLVFIVLRTTAKNPFMFVLAYPILACLGLLLGGGGPARPLESFHGYFIAAITAYTLFAMTVAALQRSARFDHLPLSRRRLLGILLLPQVACLVLGSATGAAIGAWRGSLAAPAASPILATLLTGSLFLIALGIYLGWLRAAVGDRRRGLVFTTILMVLLALHIAPYATVLTHTVHADRISTFLQILTTEVVAAVPGGTLFLAAATVVILGLLLRWVVARLERAELPWTEGCGF